MAVGAVFDDVSTKFLGDTFDAVFAMATHGGKFSTGALSIGQGTPKP
jgi:hypothetical protein